MNLLLLSPVFTEFLREEKEKLDVLEAEVVQYKRNLEPALQRVREIEENISIRENQIKKIKILRAHMKRGMQLNESGLPAKRRRIIGRLFFS